jgi:hypothetical protein
MILSSRVRIQLLMALGGIEERKMYADQCPAEFAQLAEQSTNDFQVRGFGFSYFWYLEKIEKIKKYSYQWLA